MTRTQKVGAAVVALLALIVLLTVGRQLFREAPAPLVAKAPEPAPTPPAPAAPVVSLAPAGAARVVHEPPLENGAFAGRVLNWSTGAGVAGAQVTFEGEGGRTHTVTTGPDGGFELVPGAPGRYTLAVASASGFLPFAPEWGMSPISLYARPGLRIADVVLYLRPAIDYTGVVVDPSDQPVAGASVRLLDASLGEQAQSPLGDRFTSDARGEFTFHAPDDALLEARHPAYGPGRARLDGPAAVSHRLTIKLAPRGPRDAQLGAAGITGRVIDSRGAPVPGALVRAEHQEEGDHPLGEAPAGVDGRFALTGLDAGMHLVRAVCSGCAAARAQAMTGSDVTLTVGAAGSIAGRVVDEGGRPVPSFIVLVYRVRGVEEHVVDEATVVDAEGFFEITGLEPGEYRAQAAAQGHAASTLRPARAVGPGEPREELVLELTRGGTVTGKVVERGSGAPLGWARVSVEGLAGAGSSVLPLMNSTVTDEKGEFVLTGVTPGTHSVMAAAYAHHMTMASGVVVEEDGRVGPLVFQLGATKDGEVPKMELFGVGAKLKAHDDALLIEEVFAGGGAQLAGVVAGDAVVKVDGRLVTDLGFQQAIQLIRGPEGTRIVLGLRRAGGQVIDVAIERKRITF